MQPVVTIGDTWPEPATFHCRHQTATNSQLSPFGTGRVVNVKTLENCSLPNGSMAIQLSMSRETQVPFIMTICPCSTNVVWPTLVPSFVDQQSKAMDVALEKRRFDTFQSFEFFSNCLAVEIDRPISMEQLGKL